MKNEEAKNAKAGTSRMYHGVYQRYLKFGKNKYVLKRNAVINSSNETIKMAKKAHYPIHLITKCLSFIINDNHEKRIQMKDHQLKGEWRRYREFQPARIGNKSGKELDQWIVVYSMEGSKLKLTLVTTGNHSIFNKTKPAKIIKNTKYLGKM
nr:type II toxin-antitoxin system YafQ family toxin [Lactobacillus amylovorus]